MATAHAVTAQNVEAFLYRAARLSDAGDLNGWLALCRPDMMYRERSVLTNERSYDVGLIDDDRAALESRVRSIEQFWHAEEPRTHLLHLITNVEILAERADGISVGSAVAVVATRRERQAIFYGRYRDELRILREVRKDALDADQLLEPTVTEQAREKDLGHPAGRELGDERVFPEAAGFGGPRCLHLFEYTP